MSIAYTSTINSSQRVAKRDLLLEFLKASGIGCEIYYPLPLHLQQCFSYLGHKEGDFPESEKAAKETIALPIYPELDEREIGYVVEKIEEVFPADQLNRQ